MIESTLSGLYLKKAIEGFKDNGYVACGAQDEYTIANEEAFWIFREGSNDVD